MPCTEATDPYAWGRRFKFCTAHHEIQDLLKRTWSSRIPTQAEFRLSGLERHGKYGGVAQPVLHGAEKELFPAVPEDTVVRVP